MADDERKRGRPSPHVIPGKVTSEPAPVEIHAEITDVHELQDQAVEKLVDEGAQAHRIAAAVIDILHRHQRHGEERSANRDLVVAAGKSPTETVAIPKWWAPLVRAVPAAIAIVTALVTAVLWVRSASVAGEREQADLRARLGQLEVEAERQHDEIQLLRASQSALWQRLNPFAPGSPANPGAIP